MPSSYSKETKVTVDTLIQKFADSRSTGCLSIRGSKVQWFLYFHQGSIIYITHSLKPEEKFERHLRYVSQHNPTLSSATRTQIRSLLTQNIQGKFYNPEYSTLTYLVNHSFLDFQEIMTFILRSSEECLESLLSVQEIEHQFQESTDFPKPLARLDSIKLLNQVREKIQKWQDLWPEIVSPYECPYLPAEDNLSTPLAKEIRQKFGKILIGLSFRELASRLKQDELTLAKKIRPLIQRGFVKLRGPQAPFEQLPLLSSGCQLSSSSSPPSPDKTIICVDDSPSVLKIIKNYLSDPQIDVHLITESPKALIEIINCKPDLVLLDVNMPNLDGYQLCKYIRNNTDLSQTPIIMVTGKSGWIDRAKAKVSGATDYLVKPFSQDELVQLVSKYIF